MQRLIQLAVSDASLLPAFVASMAVPLDALVADAPPGGSWGVGEVVGGDILIRKGPLRAPFRPSQLLAETRARQLVVCLDTTKDPRHLDERQPLRHRDWLVTASGVDSLGPGFAAAAQAILPTYAFSHRQFPNPAEALMMLMMAALERRNARDIRDLTTRSIRRGIADGVKIIREVMAETRVEETRPGVVLSLAIDGFLFVVPIDSPAWVATFHGTGPDPRPNRSPLNEHLRAVIVSDGAGVGPGAALVPPGRAVEIGLDVEPRHFVVVDP